MYHTMSKKTKMNNVNNLIERLTKKLEESDNLFKYLDITPLTKNSLIDFIKNPNQTNITQFSIPKLLSYVFKMNIIVLENTNQGIICNFHDIRPSNPYIFIYKRLYCYFIYSI